LVFLLGREAKMKFPIILFSASFIAVLLCAGLAEAKTTKTARVKIAGLSDTGVLSAPNSRAMYECEARYAGNRGFVGKDRGGLIEQCFKGLTGKYPFEVHENCTLRRC
jgi:hypothetical protein